MFRRHRLLSAALVVAAGVATLTGCTQTVSMTPAPDANNALCATVSVRLPASLGGFDRVWTDAQATGAWGAPSAILLSCGVTPPGPTTLECGTIDGIDWIIDDTEAPHYRFTTYGRVPAVEVYLNYDKVSSGDVLRALVPTLSQLESTGACTAR